MSALDTSAPSDLTADLRFLEGGGEASRLILARDWSDHPLGPPQGWSDALKSTLSMVLNSPESMILAWGREDLHFFFNETYFPLLGPRLEWAMGAPFRDVWSDAWAQARPIIDDAFAGNSQRFNDMPWKLATDRGAADTWFTFSYSRVLDAQGDVAGLFVFTNETTARVLGDAALRESEESLRLVVEGAKDHVILTTDMAGLITSWSGGAEAVLGWTAEEAMGQSASMIFTPEDRAAGQDIQEIATAAQAGCANDERWHLTRSGGRVFLNGSMHPLPADAQGRPRGFLKIARDETSRWESQQQLAALNATLEQRVAERTAERDRMWNSSPDLMLIVDFDGVFRSVNPSWTRTLGYTADELVGHHVTEFVVPEDHADTTKAYKLAAAGGAPTIQNRYRHKDGSVRWIAWTAAPAGNMTYATGRDVTAEKKRELELVQAQDALRQSQKMETVGQLTGGVAHDFNNLLTVIRGSVDMLRRDTLTPEKRTRFLDAIGETAERATKLTGQLLAFARRQALKPEVFDAAERVAAISDMLNSVTGALIRIEAQAPDEPCLVRADVSQFETALVNMAVNARDAMNGEGQLDIRLARGVAMPVIRGHGGAEGSFISIALTDTGAGMSPETISHIFEPFFTTKGIGRGTGLGLSQVFGFAKQSGGDIDVISKVGEGSTFILYLPEAEAGARPVDAPAPAEPAAEGEGLCVLVVEDNIEVGRFSTQTLQEYGYRTKWVANAEAALTALGADGSGFDIVFSDVVMPGMGGIELARRLARDMPGLPVVLASGYSHVLASGGADEFELLQKPYSAELLSRTLSRVAGQRSS